MFARRLALVMLLSGLGWLAVPSVNGQAGGASDEVRFRNPKKDYAEEVVRGVAKETINGVKVETGGKTLADVSAANIISITYGTLPGVDGPTAMKLKTSEAKELPTKVQSDYGDVLKTNPSDAKTKRYLEFRQAWWALRAADKETGEAFKAPAEAAATKLMGFAREYAKKNAWEIYPAARSAARLYWELGKPNDAANAFSFVAKADGLSNELKFEARLGEVEMLVRSGNTLTAGPALDEVAKLPGAPTVGPLKDKLTILQLVQKGIANKKTKTKPAEVKAIEDLIGKSSDASVRAFGHNMLGELYWQCDLPRDAMWSYLRVEVVDNQDREEVIKASIRVAEAFAKQGMDERAKAHREKLPSVKGS
jgi:hypothetical protein